MDPLAQEAARADVDLVVQTGCLEGSAAAGVGIEREGRGAALLPHTVGPDLEPRLTVEGEVSVLGGETQQVPAPRLGLTQALGQEVGDPVEIPEPERERAVGPVGRERGAHGAVERREADRRDEPRPAHPRSAERGWLLERERRVFEAEPEPGLSRIRLRTEDPRQPDEAAQGDQETSHSRGSRRGLSMRAGPNIMS